MFGMKKSGPTESDVKKALSTVMDPDLNIDIVTLNFISDIKITGSKVFFKLTLTTPACPVNEKLEQECKDVVGQLPGVETVEMETVDMETVEIETVEIKTVDMEILVIILMECFVTNKI